MDFVIVKFMPLQSSRNKTTENRKLMEIELCISLPGCCKGGTKPIDGAVLLGNEKIFTSEIHVVTGNVL